MVPALKILLVIAANRDAAVNGCAMLLRFSLGWVPRLKKRLIEVFELEDDEKPKRKKNQ